MPNKRQIAFTTRFPKITIVFLPNKYSLALVAYISFKSISLLSLFTVSPVV